MFWKMFIDANANNKVANRVAPSAVTVSDTRDKDGDIAASGIHMQVSACADHASDRTRYGNTYLSGSVVIADAVDDVVEDSSPERTHDDETDGRKARARSA
ncbi:TPA: hypothetical protein ACXN34_004688 [Burkholderia cepacia]